MSEKAKLFIENEKIAEIIHE